MERGHVGGCNFKGHQTWAVLAALNKILEDDTVGVGGVQEAKAFRGPVLGRARLAGIGQRAQRTARRILHRIAQLTVDVLLPVCSPIRGRRHRSRAGRRKRRRNHRVHGRLRRDRRLRPESQTGGHQQQTQDAEHQPLHVDPLSQRIHSNQSRSPSGTRPPTATAGGSSYAVDRAKTVHVGRPATGIVPRGPPHRMLGAHGSRRTVASRSMASRASGNRSPYA